MESSQINTDMSDNITVNGMLLIEHKSVCDDVNYTLFRKDDSNRVSRDNLLNIIKYNSYTKSSDTNK